MGPSESYQYMIELHIPNKEKVMAFNLSRRNTAVEEI